MSTTTISNTIKNLHNPFTTKILLSSIFTLTGVYIVMVGLITFSVVERKGIESQLKMTQSHVGSLELSYLTKTSDVSIDEAKSLGYKEIAPSYAYLNTQKFSFKN